MTDALNILSWVLLMGGVFFCVVGAVGILRFPDFIVALMPPQSPIRLVQG